MPDRAPDGQAALGADGAEQAQARQVGAGHRRGEEGGAGTVAAAGDEGLHGIDNLAAEAQEVGCRQVEDVDGEGVPARAKAQEPENHRVPGQSPQGDDGRQQVQGHGHHVESLRMGLASVIHGCECCLPGCGGWVQAQKPSAGVPGNTKM